DPRTGRRVAVGVLVATVQHLDLAGAKEDDVAGLDVDLRQFTRRLEVCAADGVGALQAVDTASAGDIEEHAPGDDRARLVDTAVGGALLGDRARREPVVDVTAIGDVGEGVPVSGRLQSHGDGVVARGEVAGVPGEGHVH